MKKTSIFFALFLVFGFSLILINGFKIDNSKNDYLNKVLSTLNQIKSASHLSYLAVSTPNDSLPFKTLIRFYKEYVNPIDTFIGSSFAWFQQNDTSKLDYYYDGKSSGRVDWGKKTISIDSFKLSKLPFRPIGPPFFNYTKSIIKYALDTKDSISIKLTDLGDTVHFSLTIYNKAIEFFGKPVYMDLTNYDTPVINSQYDIWISKSDNLPCRLRRKMPNNTSFETCKNVVLNKDFSTGLIPKRYFPPDFNITYRGKSPVDINSLEGKVAPNWNLKDFNNNSVTLKGLKSKILLIQFTGVGCGPCHASIPFLKQLVTDLKSTDFEFISIETWSKNVPGLKRYQESNGIGYKFLLSTDEITNSYQVLGVPVFFILDKDRVIKKIIRGYEKGVTDKEIRDVINKLI
jgi:thiol-disulfide isomerase/thioredoxin